MQTNKMTAWSLAVTLIATALTLLTAMSTHAVIPANPAASAKASPPAAAANTAPVPVSTMAHSCAACHGTHGQLGDEAFMPLAGMPETQFVRTMTDFREGRRTATLMGHVARGFSDADLRGMGQFFSAQQPLAAPTRLKAKP